jgi:hypothetical protein
MPEFSLRHLNDKRRGVQGRVDSEYRRPTPPIVDLLHKSTGVKTPGYSVRESLVNEAAKWDSVQIFLTLSQAKNERSWERAG